MSNCALCPLHGAVSNGIPAELVCPGGKKQDACSSSLLAYIGALRSSLQKKDFELNEVKWQWNERFPGCFISHYDWPRDLTWFIDRFKTASGDMRFEICYTMTDSKSIGAGDIFDNRICVGYSFTVEEAKKWIYAHHEEYPKTSSENGKEKEDA